MSEVAAPVGKIFVYGARAREWADHLWMPFQETFSVRDFARDVATYLTGKGINRFNFNYPYENEAGWGQAMVSGSIKDDNEHGYRFTVSCELVDTGVSFFGKVWHYSDPYRVKIDRNWTERGVWKHENDPERNVDSALEGAEDVLNALRDFVLVRAMGDQAERELAARCERTGDTLAFTRQGTLMEAIVLRKDKNYRDVRERGESRPQACRRALRVLESQAPAVDCFENCR